MSDSKELWQLGKLRGQLDERGRIIQMLVDYFELTSEPNDEGETDANPEWDRGFQAALALIRNPYNDA